MQESYWFKRILLLSVAYLLYLWSWQTAFASDSIQKPLSILLKGHLDTEKIQLAEQGLSSLSMSTPLILKINSTTGDLTAALTLSKKIYELKNEKNAPVIVYIQDNAIGPAAIFPFLADSLYVSNFISWGDIPFGNEKLYSPNVLRNRVINLIDSKNPKAAQLRLIASAMIDPSVQLVEEENQWKLANENRLSTSPTLTTKGETLVVNHRQISDLGIVKDILSLEEFNALYLLSEEGTTTAPPSSIEEKNLSSLEMELKKHILFNLQGPNAIGLITIDDHSSSITQATWLYVKAALEHYKETKPVFILLELNTPGGEVFAAQKISDALKEFDTQYNIPVVAYINNWAISAGAMLAYSCRFIVVAKDASMGAAEPVTENAEGKMEPVSEKVNSALRTDFANRARFFGRNPLLAEAMVDKDLILVSRFGKIVKLDNENQIRTNGTDPDMIISGKGKLLTLDAEQMIALGVADLMLPATKTIPLTSEELAEGKWPASKNPIFHQSFFEAIPEATIQSYQMDWKMRFFALLASPVVSSLLMMGLMLGFYLEVTTPGFGLPGTLAATCLFLIILSSYSLEIASWLEVILLFTGLAVILVELFILPTFGLLGLIGIIFFLMGLFGMMLPGIGSINFEYDTKTFNAAGTVFMERLVWLCATLVIGFIIIALLARFITPRLAGFTRLILKGNEQVGYTSVENLSSLPKPGAIGEASTTLRPSGKVVINGNQYDAMSTGQFIERGDLIVVTGIDSGTMMVSPREVSNL